MFENKLIKKFVYISIVILAFMLFTYSGTASTTAIHSNNASGSWHSQIIYFAEDGSLVYESDEEGNRIPDYSHAGYRGGGVAIPELPDKIVLDPSSSGDDTQQIQQALDDVGAMDRDDNGHRGAVLLNPGVYHISEKIVVGNSGVVLRGSGDGEDPTENTIIRAAKNIGGLSIQIGSGNASWIVASGSPMTTIVTEFVPVGSRHFEVEDAARFDEGDDIIIFHEATEDWIEAVDYGGRPLSAPNPWEPRESSLNIRMKRNISGISGNVIAVDVPVYNHLDRSLSESIIYKPDFGGLVTESGIENVRLILESDSPSSDDHGYRAIMFDGVENCWADGVTAMHFQHTGLGVTNASFVTIQNSNALEPHSPVVPPLRYNFNVRPHSNNILFTDITSSEARHSFISNGTASVSGVVFKHGTSYRTHNTSEGHRRWSQGMLFDNIVFRDTDTQRVLGLYNRGDWGTRHGWSAVHSVVWNSVGNQIVIQKPPTGQNYGIASKGNVTGDGPWEGPRGYIEGTGEDPAITSLYDTQLKERLTIGTPPDAPARVTVQPENDNEHLKLNWDHVSLEEIDLIIERSVDDGAYEKLTTVQSGTTSFVDEQVDNMDYRYRIVAVEDGRRSAYSNIAGYNFSFNPFALSSPRSGSAVSIVDDPDQNLAFWWEELETDFDVSYIWYLDDIEGDFSDPLLTKETDIILVEVSHHELAEVLKKMDIGQSEVYEAHWTVKAVDGSQEVWAEESFPIQFTLEDQATSSLADMADKPDNLELKQNYPNPFNPSTNIAFSLPNESNVRVAVYDLLGREMDVLINRFLTPGSYNISWDASHHSSGIYIYRLETRNKTITRRMTLIK